MIRLKADLSSQQLMRIEVDISDCRLPTLNVIFARRKLRAVYLLAKLPKKPLH